MPLRRSGTASNAACATVPELQRTTPLRGVSRRVRDTHLGRFRYAFSNFGRSTSPWAVNNSSSRLRMIMPGRSDGMCFSILRLMSTMASGSVDSRISRSSAMIAASQSISFLRRAVGLGVVAEQDLHTWISPSEIGVAQLKIRWRTPDGYFHVEPTAERHEPFVAHVTLRRRLGGAGDARCVGRIAYRDDGLGLEPVVGLDDLVFLRARLVDVAEGVLVHEGEMRVVERVLHQPQRRGVPLAVELLDAAIAGIAILGHVRDVAERLVSATQT